MVKTESRKILSSLKTGREFWLEAVKDADNMIKEAKQRVRDLEASKRQFKHYAEIDFPRPGEERSAGTESVPA